MPEDRTDTQPPEHSGSDSSPCYAVGDLVRELHREGCIAPGCAELTEIILDKWINQSHRYGMTIEDVGNVPLTAVDVITMLWDSLTRKDGRGWDRAFLKREVDRFTDAA